MQVLKLNEFPDLLKNKVAAGFEKLKNYCRAHPSVFNILISGLFIFILLFVFITLANLSPNLQNAIMVIMPAKKQQVSSQEIDINKYIEKLKIENRGIERKLSSVLPYGGYLVVNTTENSFRLYNSGKLKREGSCSTGSSVLLHADSTQQWIFKTPKGVFRIQGKTESPVWRKPDWAFIEEGLPVPASYASERYEYGVLGDYALSLGDGYLIHGTLYKRQLGMPVTHGCIRMGDEDLEAVYYALQGGSKVFIY